MRILLNIGTHGDEHIGNTIAEAIQKLTIIKGSVDVAIANELAYQRNTRFIDQDLNRSFPGKKKGNHEQRLAYKLLPIIRSYDIVLDIHSTTSELKDALIVTKLTKKTREYITSINPKYVLWMRATGKTALISNAKIGLAFEYGKDKDAVAAKKVIADIQRLLAYLKMIPQKYAKPGTPRTTVFDVFASVPKPSGALLRGSIKNYKLVPRGSIYAMNNTKPLKAKRDFYPILFGQNNYQSIFGFAAKKIS